MEFALVAVPLLILLLGIIYFGVVLSFKQAVTQAAAEAARKAAPFTQASYRPGDVTAAANGPLGSWSKTCDSAGVTCDIRTPWSGAALPGDPPCVSDTANPCIRVRVTYDYRDHPLLPQLPLVSSMLPGWISSTAVVQMTPLGAS